LRSVSRKPQCAKPICQLEKLALFSNQVPPAKDRPQNGREKRDKLYDMRQIYAPIHSLPNLRAVDLPTEGQDVQHVSFRIPTDFAGKQMRQRSLDVFVTEQQVSRKRSIL